MRKYNKKYLLLLLTPFLLILFSDPLVTEETVVKRTVEVVVKYNEKTQTSETITDYETGFELNNNLLK